MSKSMNYSSFADNDDNPIRQSFLSQGSGYQHAVHIVDVADADYEDHLLGAKIEANNNMTSPKENMDDLNRTLNCVRSIFFIAMSLSLVLIIALWSSSTSVSRASSLSSVPTSLSRREGGTQVFSDDGADDVIELDDDCSTCPEKTTTCADPSYGPVLGGVDFVATYNLYNATAYDLGLNQTVAPLGSDSITAYWGVSAVNPSMNYTFYFTSEDNRDTFLGNPAKYLPKWGSFCAFGIASEICPNSAWSASCLGPYGNRHIWAMYDDRLYFFLRESAFLLFKQDVTNYIISGTNRWQTWFKESIADDQYIFNTACYKSQYF